MEIDFSSLDRALADPGGKTQAKATNYAIAKKYLRLLAKRKMEGLTLYRALPTIERFHSSLKAIRLLDGPNQVGKTLAGEVEVARAVTGTDPFQKYPRKNGVALIVGHNAQHLADPMFRTLRQPGAFSIIKDEQTGAWRSVRLDPNDSGRLDPYDEAYREKWRDAPPLLPERILPERCINWEDRGKGIPRVITIPSTGWKMYWHTADGRARRGIQLHLWHFDEEITNQEFLPEAMRGAMRHGGRGFWSATPQTGGLQLFELHEKAIAGEPDVEAFTLFMEDCPFYRQQDRQVFINSLSDEEKEARVYGRYPTYGRRIYPNFAMGGIHGCDPFEVSQRWTRYVILDPGRHCGTVFVAIDPDERHVWVYDALNLTHNDPGMWADEVYKRQGKNRFEAMVIDRRYGRETHGSPENVAYYYAEALRERNALPHTLGPLHGFFPGNDDIEAREKALLDMMAVRGTPPFVGTPILQVFRGRMPVLEKQVTNAQIDPKTGKRAKQPCDVLQALEYAAGARSLLRFMQPEPTAKPGTDVVLDNFRKQQQRRQRRATILSRQ